MTLEASPGGDEEHDEQWNERCSGLACCGVSGSHRGATFVRGRKLVAGPRRLYGAWGEVIRDEDRPTVRAISLQRWSGQFWSGQWEHQMYLAVPAARGTTKPGGEESAEEAPEIDPDSDAEGASASAKAKKK